MNIIHLAFDGKEMHFRDDGWFNATLGAMHFRKRIQDYLDNKETAIYLAALAQHLNHANQRDLMKSTRGRGGGTWFHPKLAVHFARWLSVEFAVWCDLQIDQLVRGYDDHKRARHVTASSHKVMCKLLQVSRRSEGKDTIWKHYSNESRLVNWALGAGFEGLDRDQMTVEQLDALAAVEIENAVMIGSHVPYDERKQALGQRRLSAPALGELPVRKSKKALSKAA